MGVLSHRVEATDLSVGDHIYTWRTAFAYAHHGIYVGKNKVLHFTHDHDLSSPTNSSSAWFSSSVSFLSKTSVACLGIPDCGFKNNTSGVIMSCLNCFLGNGLLYRFEYGASRLAFIAKFRGGTCTTAKSDPPEAVIHRAMYLLHNGFGNYDLFTNNCEDFALYCKTGLLVRGEGASGQATSATSAAGAPLAAMLSVLVQNVVPGPVGFVAATASMYSLSRYAQDIGVRGDAFEVKVEDIALFHGNGDGDEDVCSGVIKGKETRPVKRQRNF